MSRLFLSSGQSIGASASVSMLPMNIQSWFPLGLTGLISLQTKGPSRVFSSTTICFFVFLFLRYLEDFILFIIIIFYCCSFIFFLICSEFCHTLKWNGLEFTCLPHPDPPSHLPLHPLPPGLPRGPGPSACLIPAPQFESISSSVISLLHGPTVTSIHNYWKNHSFGS